MSFADDIKTFTLKVEAQNNAIFSGVVDLTHESIQSGSAVTGAPGQPVDTGNLRASWQKQFTSPTEALISTNVVYAQPIEEGVGPHGPLTLRSTVGGFHSVKQTIAGFQNIVSMVTRKAG